MKTILKPFNILLIANVILILIVLSYVFSIESTGFVEYRIEKGDGYTVIPGKTLWDWMQLLIIPLALVVGGYFLNRAEKNRDLEAAKERANLDREITKIRNEEVALSVYIDRMSELIHEKHILNPNVSQSIRDVSRTRTIAIISRLTENRISIVINFLKDSGLISSENSKLINEIVDFKKADLSYFNISQAKLQGVILNSANLVGANLKGTDLTRANLEGANLEGTNLEGAILEGANLNEATLVGANLKGANLTGANLREANLREANLQDVNLQKAFLGRAFLLSATLEGADLLNAKGLRPLQLRQAFFVMKPPMNLPETIIPPPQKKIDG